MATSQRGNSIPVSHGVVAWTRDAVTGERLYVMIRPRSSYNFLFVIFGRYDSDDDLPELIAEMTPHEQEQLADEDKWSFEEVWRDTWAGPGGTTRMVASRVIRQKFHAKRPLYAQIVRDLRRPSASASASDSASASASASPVADFSIPLAFPKGRADFSCDGGNSTKTALREFREETTLPNDILFEPGVQAEEDTEWHGRRWRAIYHLGELLPTAAQPDASSMARTSGEIPRTRVAAPDGIAIPFAEASDDADIVRPTLSGEADAVFLLPLGEATARTNTRRAEILRKFDAYLAQVDTLLDSIASCANQSIGGAASASARSKTGRTGTSRTKRRSSAPARTQTPARHNEDSNANRPPPPPAFPRTGRPRGASRC
jgi:8-oxo-dGTP pyrophosphatase MutT (NUDIX family)